MTPEQARGIPKPKFQKDISTPTEPEKKFKRKRNDISSELKGMINETLKFSKREEEARATALLKTRTLEAHQAEVLMNISPLFRGPSYKLTRVIISKWAGLQKKMNKMRILSPFDDVDLSQECALLIELSKFQNPKLSYWAELVSYL